MSTGMVTDSQGNFQPSGMRFGFMSFEALPGQNPFQSLSEYNGDLGDAREEVGAEVAVVDSTPAPPRPRDQPSRPPVETYEAPPPVETYEAPPPVETYEAPPPVETYEAPPPVETYEAPPPVETQTPTYVEAATPTYVEEVTPTYVEAATPTYVEEVTPTYVEEPVVEASCDDLITLESFAMMGQLGVERRKCLETRLSGEAQLTGQSKISRVLINDAKARSDQADWERLMRRHLSEIDRSDPNMCLVYSIHLSRGGVGRSSEVIRWAGYALENKAQWSGGAHTRNVYNLNKLRAQAAHRLWKSAEDRFTDDRNDANEAKASRYRNKAKTFAREWLDYAKASGKDTSQPMTMCVSAAGSTEYCPG